MKEINQNEEKTTTLFKMFYDIENEEEKIEFAKEKLFYDKRALSKSFNLIDNKKEKLDFIEEYIENSQLKSNTYIEDENNKKISFKNEFVLAFTDNLEKLAFEFKITNSELRVITYILKRMEFGNLIMLKQASIAEAVGLKPSNMSAIFSKLKQKKILIEDEEKNLFMNSNIFAKGLNHRMNKEKRQDLKKSKLTTEYITESFK